MAVKATVSIHKARIKESLASVLIRLTSFQSKYPVEFETFLKKDEIKRNLKTLSSYLN